MIKYNHIMLKSNLKNLTTFFSIIILSITFLSPTTTHADVLLPGNINTCGEIAVSGIYTLTSNINSATSTCFTVSADNVIINGGGYTITGSSTVAIDARVRVAGPGSTLVEGANGYNNLIVNLLTITGFTTGIDLSGNNDSSGTGAGNGHGGNGGDVATYYSSVGSIKSSGGNSTTQVYGGLGGNISLTHLNLDISNITISAIGGVGTGGRNNTDGGLDLNYTGTLTKTNLTLSSLSFFNDNTMEYGVYIGGTWPIVPGNISTCGTLYGSGTFTLTENLISTSTCFNIATNNITIVGGGFSLTSSTSTNANYAINASSFSSTTIDNLTVTNFQNLITSSSSVIIKGGNLNLSTKKINSPNITIDAGTLNLATTTFISDLLEINYSVSISGTSTATSTALTNLRINNLDYGSRTISNPLFGDVWRENTSAGLLSWNALATSVDGKKIIAGSIIGYIYGSIDGGKTWTQRTFDTTRAWESIAMSADGQKIVALGQNTYVYISLDGGFTWTARMTDSVKSWYSVTMSADGSKILAGTGNGYLYVSSDGGETWAVKMTDSARYWYNLASSADGTKLFAAPGSGYIYISIDGGDTWATSTNSGSRSWGAIASSDDGLKVVAGASSNYLYVSNDSGSTWTPRMTDTTRNWSSITSSSNGVILAASVYGNKIYTSTDSGVNWKAEASNRNWDKISSSKDGNKMIAGVGAGSGYTYTSSRFPAIFSVDTVIPFASSSILEWKPVISWGISKSCYYSYDNFVSTSTANCALGGSDIISPATTGSTTLYVKGISNMNEVITKSVSFINNSNTNIQVSLPALNTSYDALSWFPFVDYGTSDATLVTCEYSYNNFASTTDTDCSLNGTDILPPTDGLNTLSIRTVDSNGNVNTLNTVFTYLYSFVKNSLGGSHYWQYDNFAMSADGMKILANMTNGYIWTSINGGSTWVQRTSDTTRSWYATASSDDGVKFVAAVGSGYIYTSTDSGATWTQRGTTTRPWFKLTSSSDGVNLAASTFSGYIYTSNDSGINWVQRTGSGSRYWYGLASSDDGLKLAGVPDNGYIYISPDGGVTWATSTSAGSRTWVSIASSADGTKLVAAASGGYIYTSTDSGATWTTRMNDSVRSWHGVASSADGMTLVAGNVQGYVYISKNGGVTWVPHTTIGKGYWYNVEISKDGKKVLVANNTDDKSLYVLDFDKVDTFLNLYLTIIRPVAGTDLTNALWSPLVSWGSRKILCQYSYDNFVSTSTADCSLGGADILTPPTDGSKTLYLKSVDALNNISLANVTFGFIAGGWSLVDNMIGSWGSVDLSGNGLKMVAGDNYDIYTSTDAGINWSKTSAPKPTNSWNDVSLSFDGTNVVAGGGPSYIYFSRDSGLNWTQATSSGSATWNSIASSADGSRVTAVKSGGIVYNSSDYGKTWVQSSFNSGKSFYNMTSSADGTKLATAAYSGYIYLSTDSGVTWSTSTGSMTLGTKSWYDITSSADGTKLAANATNGYIYISTDSGQTWATSTGSLSLGTKSWEFIKSSADGEKLFAVVSAGHIYSSENGGLTWAISTSGTNKNWYSFDLSADGNRALAGTLTSSGALYRYTKTPMILNVTPLLPQNLATTSAWNPIISWSTGVSCYYSYDNFVSTSTANCALNGSDISSPTTAGVTTLSIRAIDTQGNTDTASSIFTYAPHFWCGTVDSSWTTVGNWYSNNTCTTPIGSIPGVSHGAILLGAVSPIVSSTTTLPLLINSTGLTGGANAVGIIFESLGFNTTRIIGNATFNNTGYNIGTITGNATFNTATAGTLTLTNTMKWGGTVSGTIKGSDGVDITHLIFNNSSSNTTTIPSNFSAVFNNSASNFGIINGDVTFNNTGLFTMGTVNGTSTLNGLSQTLNGVNNVINLVKTVTTSVRDTFYIVAESILNVSGHTTVLGYDANNLLTIRSTTPGVSANIGINGTSTLNFLRLKDIYNTGNNLDLSLRTVFDDLGNTGFTFSASSTPTQRNGFTSQYTQLGDPIFPGNISACGNLNFAGTYTLSQDITGNCNVMVTGVIIDGAGHTISGDVSTNNFGATLSNINITGSVTSTGAGAGTITVNGTSTLSGAINVTGAIAGDNSSSLANTTINVGGSVATSSVSFTGDVINYGTINTGNPVARKITNTAIINGDFTFNASSTNSGTVNGDAMLNASSTNTGTVVGDLTFNEFSSDENGTVVFDNNYIFFGTGHVSGNIFDSTGTTTITNWSFNDSSSNQGYTVGDIYLSDNSSNSGTISGTAYLSDYSSNSGTISGDAYLSDHSTNTGTVMGNIYVYYDVTPSSIGTVNGTVTYHAYPNAKAFANISGDNAWGNVVNWFTDTTMSTPLGYIPADNDDVILFASVNLSTDVTNNVYIATSSITINGSGHKLTGHISGDGAYGGYDAYSFNLANITVTGTTTATGGEGIPGLSDGGKGGAINIATSSTGLVTVNGGDPEQNGGDAGRVVMTNSYAIQEGTHILAIGGDSIGCGYGGSGGDISLFNSSGYILITATGADATSTCIVVPPSPVNRTSGQGSTVGTYQDPNTPVTPPTVPNSDLNNNGVPVKGNSTTYSGTIDLFINPNFKPIDFDKLPTVYLFNKPNRASRPLLVGFTTLPNIFANLKTPEELSFITTPAKFLTNVFKFIGGLGQGSTKAKNITDDIYMKELGIDVNNEQSLAKLRTNPVKITTEIIKNNSIFYIVRSGKSTLATYLTYESKSRSLAQLVKVIAGQNLTITLNSKDSKSIDYKAPNKAGQYIINQEGGNITLIVEVLDTTRVETKKGGFWDWVRGWFR
jgi:hypothetical protein